MKRPLWEVADVLQRFGAALRATHRLGAPVVLRTLDAIQQCRTAALGGHVYACSECGQVHIAYNSCRNRHCPKCQAVERQAWILARQDELLPVPYYHVVFTLPGELNGLRRHNPRFVYELLFDAAWKTLQLFARDERWLGARTGAALVLHTWGQTLSLHPHVHGIVPGGGLAADGRWQTARRSARGRFLFPVKAMSRVFRTVFLRRLCAALKTGLLTLPEGFPAGKDYRRWRDKLYRTGWVVYAKRPFGGPSQVIEYLGRYTHKVAISNHRILAVGEQGVQFSYKDYAQQGRRRTMTLSGVEFLRRFTLHLLPAGFRRMRHYGILSNAAKMQALAACRSAWGVSLTSTAPKPSRQERRQLARQQLLGRPPDLCPVCRQGLLVLVDIIPRQRAPPVQESRLAHASPLP